MSAKRTTRRAVKELPTRGSADLEYLRNVSDEEIMRTSPPELRELPAAFWEKAVLVAPPTKDAISLRVDSDVLEWFRSEGPRYQSRMNAVLRSYMERTRQQPKAPKKMKKRRARSR